MPGWGRMVSSLNTPGGAAKRLRRFDHLVNVLIKYGFSKALTRIRIWESVTFRRRSLRRDHKFPEFTAAHRLRLALEELGPTFIN